MIQDLINGYKIARDLRKIDDDDWEGTPIEETKMWRESWQIPMDKLRDQRFGQLIFNALGRS
jgi:hypothetical protein